MKVLGLILLISIISSALSFSCSFNFNLNRTTSCGYGSCSIKPDSNGTCICYGTFVDSMDMPCNQCPVGSKVDNTSIPVKCVPESNPCENLDCGVGSSECILVIAGSFSQAKCICKMGYMPSNEGRCTDCSPGYELINGVCVKKTAFDFCSTAKCGNNSVCMNSTFGYKCVCEMGFVRSADGSCMLPVSDPCSLAPCGNNMCFNNNNTLGGFVCKCSEGYTNSFTFENGVSMINYCSLCSPGYAPSRFNIAGLVCEKIEVPCSTKQCGFGYCKFEFNNTGTVSTINEFCVCPPNFKNDIDFCSVCNDGFVDSADGAKCSACAPGFRREGSICIGVNASVCDFCGTQGSCANITTLDGRNFEGCKCREGWANDKLGEPCSVCVSPVSSTQNDCKMPMNVEDCQMQVKTNDPNAICVGIYTGLSSTNVLGTLTGFKVVCDKKFLRDTSTGLCSRCAPGYDNYPSCDISKCAYPCINGKCVEKRSTSSIPSYGCECARLYTGTQCDFLNETIALALVVNGCSKCTGNSICAKLEILLDSSIAGSQSVSSYDFTCLCKDGFEDLVSSDGSRKPCAVCRKDRTGPECKDMVLESNLCDTIACPQGTKCEIRLRNGTAVFGCKCPDGSLFGDNNKCSNMDNDVALCSTVLCPENAFCIPSETGTRCVCKRGSNYVKLDDGTFSCVATNEDCPLDCGDERTCVNVPDSSTGSVSPRCVCKLRNTEFSDVSNKCECMSGFSGKFCNEREDLCLSVKCPTNSRCVQYEDETRCVCSGTLGGLSCNVDACANVTCGKMAVCNRDGACVCPLTMLLDQNGNCMPKVNITTVTCTETEKCFVLPEEREISITEASNTTIKISLKNKILEKIDNIETELSGGVGKALQLCLNRKLETDINNTVNIEANSKYCLNLERIYLLDVGADGLENSTVGTITSDFIIGEGENIFDDFVNEVDNVSKKIFFDLYVRNRWAYLSCVVSGNNDLADGVAVNPNAVKCGLGFNIPSTWYTNPETKVCFEIQFENKTLGKVSMSDDPTSSTVNFASQDSTGMDNGLTGSVALETSAFIGTSSVDIAYQSTANAKGVLLKGCINAFSPDNLFIDPEVATGGSYTSAQASTPSTSPSGTPSTNPSGTPSTNPSGTPSTNPSGTPSTTPSTTPSGTPSTTTPSAPQNNQVPSSASSIVVSLTIIVGLLFVVIF